MTPCKLSFGIVITYLFLATVFKKCIILTAEATCFIFYVLIIILYRGLNVDVSIHRTLLPRVNLTKTFLSHTGLKTTKLTAIFGVTGN